MATVISCPECGKKLKVAETAVGKRVKCPGCGATFTAEVSGDGAGASPPDEEVAKSEAVTARRGASPASREESDGGPAEDEEVRPRRRRLRDEEDEEQDEEEDRPRRSRVARRRRPADEDDEDEDEGPVRRRKKRRRSGPGFPVGTVVAGLVLVGLIGLIIAGVVYVVNHGLSFLNPSPIPDTEWQAFSPPGGKFTALMPGSPQQQMMPGAGGVMGTKWLVQRPDRDVVFAVAYFDIPAFAMRPTILQDMTDGERDNMAKTIEGKVSSEKAITMGGFQGREFTIKPPGRGAVVERVFLANQGGVNRAYVAVCGGRDISADSPDMAKFFDSFKISP